MSGAPTYQPRAFHRSRVAVLCTSAEQEATLLSQGWRRGEAVDSHAGMPASGFLGSGGLGPASTAH